MARMQVCILDLLMYQPNSRTNFNAQREQGNGALMNSALSMEKTLQRSANCMTVQRQERLYCM